MFQFNFFCPLQRTQWTGWVSGGYDTQNRNFAIKQKEMSLFWHQIFVLYLWNFTSGAPFLGSNRWIATEMCDLIVQRSEDLHKTFKKREKDDGFSDIGLVLMFPLKENYLQVVQSWAPHQNHQLSSVAAEVCYTNCRQLFNRRTSKQQPWMSGHAIVCISAWAAGNNRLNCESWTLKPCV